MKTTLEKVLILKSAPMFSEIAEDQLAALARVTREIEAAPQEPIITEGETGESMYIIAEGAVQISAQGRVLAVLGPKEVFGELAVLDPEPRSATAIALENCLLYEISESALYELMAEAPQIARGIIRVLCRRLRSR
ncbi:MAG: Crp/Fnr family transcriptional regulator [Campylobacterales bacterium]